MLFEFTWFDLEIIFGIGSPTSIGDSDNAGLDDDWFLINKRFLRRMNNFQRKYTHEVDTRENKLVRNFIQIMKFF